MAGELVVSGVDDLLALQRQTLASIEALRQEVGTLATQEQADALAAQMTALGDRLSAGQDALAADVTALKAATGELQAELAAAVAANPTVDLSAAQDAANRADALATGLGATVGQVGDAVAAAQQLADANEPPPPATGP